jgi:AraC-like DNA-binding protein
MQTDRLEALLSRFRVSARMFHSGPLCGVNDFAPEQGRGQLHLVQQGALRVEHPDGSSIDVAEPSLLFYPRPHAHRFISDERRGADMACALIEFGDGARNPLTAALPACICLPLAQLEDTQAVLELLFREAFAQRCGRQLVVDRLFEVVLIQILRQQMAQAPERSGLFAGLAHPQLSRALIAMHGEPGKPWTLATLAETCGMSRTQFAETFRVQVGITPGDYLAGWRLTIAQQLLDAGRPLKLIVDEVGYGSVAALSRAFKSQTGTSPRAWLRTRNSHD